MISEDRTDPFTESANFERDTQDEFVAQEFDKLSLFVRQPQAEPAAEMIHVSPMPMYSET
jgi:hypothetical protein